MSINILGTNMPTGIPKNGINKGWFKNGDKGFWTGKKRPEIRSWLPSKPSIETRRKISAANKRDTGENARNWKGDNVGYDGLHHWIRKLLGNSDTCKRCKKSGLKGHKIHWANKSGKYKRNRNDWIRLCVRCHSLYDKKH